MADSERAISTVMDVAMALLIISASVLLVGLFLAGDDREVEDDRADRAYETLAGSTLSVTYDVSSENESGVAATDSKNFELPENLDPEQVSERYRITTYGAATDMLSEAALTNLQIDDRRLFAYGDDFERSVDGAIRGTLTGGEHNRYAVATWEPYEGASISGTATAGDRPPITEDVSSTSVTVSADVPPVDAAEMAEEFEREQTSAVGTPILDPAEADGFDAAAAVLADALIEGYYPLEGSQYALESTLPERSVTAYNYRQLADAVGVDIEDEITGTTPHAAAANENVAGEIDGDDGLTDALAADMRSGTVGEEITDTWERSTESEVEAELEEAFDELVSPETVDLTVQVWDP